MRLTGFRKKIIDNFAHRPALKRILVRFFIIRELDHKARWRIIRGLLTFTISISSFIYAHFLNVGSQTKVSFLAAKAAHMSLLNTTGHKLLLVFGFLCLLLSIYFLGKAAYGLLKELALVEGSDDENEITFRSVYDRILPTIQADEAEGFYIERLSNGDLISRSDAVDQYLIQRPFISVSVGKSPIHFYRENIDPKTLPSLGLRLMNQATKSKDTYFFNEPKVSLQTDLAAGQSSVRIAQTSYFVTQISNYACRFIGFDEFGSPRHNLTTLFPVYEGGLLPLARSTLSNQIGVSTLCLDVDGHPFIVLQGSRVFSNPDTLAPTGSGSMDWEDWLHLRRTRSSPDLLSLVEFATRREFAEENSLGVNELPGFTNLIIGFFRYIENGGLPEFISISRIGVSFKHLKPDNREIQSILAYKRVRSSSDVLAFCAEIDAERPIADGSETKFAQGGDPKKKRVSLPLRVLCARLASTLRGDLGPEARRTVLEFWMLDS